jgi:hypothetical protein
MYSPNKAMRDGNEPQSLNSAVISNLLSIADHIESAFG